MRVRKIYGEGAPVNWESCDLQLGVGADGGAALDTCLHFLAGVLVKERKKNVWIGDSLVST